MDFKVLGKTTTAGKLANLLRKQGKKPLLVACDVYRPAAIKQLQVVGSQLNIPVFANENSKDVVRIAKQAISEAYSKLNDVIILDTAGRLHIDEELMQELKNVKANVKPHEILLVVDSMTGQDAVNVAEKFNEALAELQKESILFYIKDLQIDMESKEKILAFIKLELKKQSKE